MVSVYVMRSDSLCLRGGMHISTPTYKLALVVEGQTGSLGICDLSMDQSSDTRRALTPSYFHRVSRISVGSEYCLQR